MPPVNAFDVDKSVIVDKVTHPDKILVIETMHMKKNKKSSLSFHHDNIF